MLQPALEAIFFAHIAPELRATHYVFTNSDFSVKPLRTYTAEADGAAVEMDFYATSIQAFGPFQAARGLFRRLPNHDLGQYLGA